MPLIFENCLPLGQFSSEKNLTCSKNYYNWKMDGQFLDSLFPIDQWLDSTWANSREQSGEKRSTSKSELFMLKY